jgi:ribosomal protein L7/L12
MGRHAQVLATAIASGALLEAGLAQLRDMGATPVETSKAIREAQGVSLGEAKQIFSQSPAWSGDIRVANALHDEIFSLQANEKTS